MEGTSIAITTTFQDYVVWWTSLTPLVARTSYRVMGCKRMTLLTQSREEFGVNIDFLSAYAHVMCSGNFFSLASGVA
jgi:hypothetical protein